MNYFDKLVHVLNTGNDQSELSIGGLSTVEIETGHLSNDTIKDALNRTITKNSRLSSIIRDFDTVPAGDVLSDLVVNCKITKVQENWDMKAKQATLEFLLNYQIDHTQLPWHMEFFKSPIFKKGDKKYVELHVGIKISHALTDGMGMTMILKSFVESLSEAMESKEPISQDTLLTKEGGPCSYKHQKILDPRFGDFGIFWIFVFLWRAIYGQLILLYILHGLFFPVYKYKSSLDPAALKNKKVERLNGYRHLKINKDLTESLRAKARAQGSTVGSALQAACMIASRKLIEKKDGHSEYFNYVNIVNIRPFSVCEPHVISEMKGNSILNHNNYGYHMTSKDLFWEHAKKLKHKMNHLVSYTGASCKMLLMIPRQVILQLYSLQKVHHQRDYSFVMSNVGNFNRDQVSWAPKITVKDVCGTASTNFRGNRCLFGVTSITIDGELGLNIVFPAYYVPDEDADFFVEMLEHALASAVEINAPLETITVGSNLTETIAKHVTTEIPVSAYVFVTDENVAPLHLNNLMDQFSKITSKKLLKHVIPAGEVYKTRETKAAVEDFMLGQSCTRDTCLIALGGGVIGDLVGFVAANFMRGIPVVQVPTTLLAMVDSSVGGKTAIDTPHGKNLIGAFHQPKHIFIDINYLKTLPKREFVNGLAEVIKTAAIWMEKDFEMLENHPDKILGLVGGSNDVESEELLVKVILGSVQVKAHVVTVDEKETGLRGLLNFGHTVGHAIEAIVFPDLLHGECVSIGMVIEAEISRHLGHLNNVSVGRLVKCLQSYGLPVSLFDKIYKQRTKRVCTVEQMLNIMKVDKKNQGDKKRMVLLATIGKTYEPNASFVEDKIITRVLSAAVQVVPQDKTGKSASLNVPGSKSISNRALVMAALGRGKCKLRGLLHSDDVQVMLESLQKLVGISFNWEDGGETLVIEGGAGRLRVPDSELYLGNAGTASRFLTSVCSLISEPHKAGFPTVLTGNARMKQRPIGPLVTALQQNGSKVKYLENEGCFPLEITPNNGLAGGTIKLSASVSSQYVSSILISAPYAQNEVLLDLTGDSVISQPYIDMTIAMMKSFGIQVERLENSNKYRIPKGVYMNPPEYLVEADASSATYPLAFAAITGSTVTVNNIGSNSLQGDAEFAVKVLEKMGCTVTQTPSTTTVTGPKNLLPIPHIDMESMTDAFMTATVLAAVAQNPSGEYGNTTRITGIANQRVKECDRIAAMIEQLARLGVSASELPDGLQIHGIDRKNLQSINPSGIKCFDDHRIAMSFSVLACAYPIGVPGLTITEKKCVEKTWPSWWDTLRNTLGMELVGIDLDHHALFGKASQVPKVSKVGEKSIILIGMRGAGKTHVGRAAAKNLGLRFIDMDHYLEYEAKCTIPEYIAQNGWDAFRNLEAKCLEQVTKANISGAVIACGGGVVEREENRDLLKAWEGLVIHIKRDINEIEKYLSIDKTRPTYNDDLRATYARRLPYFHECSNSEFYVLSPGDSQDVKQHYQKVDATFSKFVNFKLASRPFETPQSQLSFFVSLTCPNVVDILDILDEISEGADALELRVDLLESTTVDIVCENVAVLKANTNLPIIYTVRTEGQGGKFPSNETERMIELLSFGLKWGCEVVDVEFTSPVEQFDGLIQSKGNSLLLGSYHDVAGKATWDKTGTMSAKYKELHASSDIIKLIGRAARFQDNFALYNFVDEVVPQMNLSKKPLIALLMGAEGQLSRSLNTFYTPVTHPSLKVSAAPGQVTIKQIHQTRSNIGMINPRKFCLFGKPIQSSMSPTLHNTGFETLGLPNNYSLYETDSWKDVVDTMKSFDGASVTIPLKVDVLQNNICDYVDEAAKKIGAINTLHKIDGKISGYNTDWIGIKRSIENVLNTDLPVIGIVLGAGGTSRAALYALSHIKQVSETRIWNRTCSKAEALAAEFNAKLVGDLNSIFVHNEPEVVFVVVGTIPAPAQEALNFSSVFSKAAQYSFGIVVDMAYRPRSTHLIEASLNLEKKWHQIEGIQVLLEQGYEQFELWTGRHAPKKSIHKTVMEKY
ncbi:3-dehydroquinate dehydratase (3-dehydroquinase) [Boothiomyces macroporosus]|uniref:Pentafunctional AROM polypeptide n=1 Tax=Boothiomyces macroporosus TaxID=261099 RepID=A0AAD5ULG6_9FUNG|nr:3-dehydroquinate dehydratase (3-dehydroquinase) [Boothiomyces macroporosus]